MRLFIAIPISDHNKTIIREMVGPLKNLYQASWVKPENYHITLQFLGEVSPESIELIDTELSNIGSTIRPFEITLSALELFPPLTKHRAIIVSVKACEEIIILANVVREKMNRLNFLPDKGFNVHLTVARIKENQRNQKISLSGCKINAIQSIQSFSLIESILKKEGPVYIDVNSYTLKGG